MDLKDAKFRIEIMKFEFEKLSEKKPESKELFLKYNEAVDTVLQELENRIPREKIEDKIKLLEQLKEKNIKNSFNTVYKDGYFTGGIDNLYELLEDWREND